MYEVAEPPRGQPHGADGRAICKGARAALAARPVVCVRVRADHRRARASRPRWTRWNFAGRTSATRAGSACSNAAAQARPGRRGSQARRSSSGDVVTRPRHRARHAPRLLWRRGGRHRGQQAHRRDRRHTSLRRTRCRPRSSIRRRSRAQIMGQMIQATSRILKEEVLFDKDGVTSLDWMSYPVLRFARASGGRARRGAAPRRAIDRRGRRGHGRDRGGDRQRVLRRDRRAAAAIPNDARAREGRALSPDIKGIRNTEKFLQIRATPRNLQALLHAARY